MSLNVIQRIPGNIIKNNLIRHVSTSPLSASEKKAELAPKKRTEITVDAFESVPDAVTHTGQKYEIDDKRRVRFSRSVKYVNPNIAQELIAQVPPIASKDRVVWCDGGDPHLGHPKVYINLDKPGNHSCGYCGLRFYLDDGHAH